MNSIMLISDLDHSFDEIALQTKQKSHSYGRRLYTLTQGHKKYWLKFHVEQHNQVLEDSFNAELEFYRQNKISSSDFLVPYNVIDLSKLNFLNETRQSGEGLLTLDTNDFFIKFNPENDLHEIRKQILLALNALEALHQSGWIHGDLKSEHFRRYLDTCRLIDFEQSQRIISPKKLLTATPHYMAPELFHGQPKSVQSDLYAFGIILYEWLCQSRLSAKTYHDWAILHCQQLQIKLPDSLQCFLPILDGLLKKKMDERFGSVAELRNAIRTINLL